MAEIKAVVAYLRAVSDPPYPAGPVTIRTGGVGKSSGNHEDNTQYAMTRSSRAGSQKQLFTKLMILSKSSPWRIRIRSPLPENESPPRYWSRR